MIANINTQDRALVQIAERHPSNIIAEEQQKYNTQAELAEESKQELVKNDLPNPISLEEARIEKEQAVRRAKVNFLCEKEGTLIVANPILLYHWWAENAAKIIKGRIVRDGNAHYIWNGTHWTLQSQESAEQLLSGIFYRVFGLELLSSYMKELWKICLRKAVVPSPPPKYYEKVRIPFLNGTLHITASDRQFYPQEWFKEDFCRFMVSTNYDEAMFTENWQESVVGRYLMEYFAPQDITTIQQYLASILVPDFYLQQVLIILGTGGDGKNILAETVASLFPQELTSWLPVSQWNGGHEMVSLANSILNTSSEVSAREVSSDIFKRITAHDMCEINPKFEKPFRVRMVPKHIFILNNNPNIKPDPAILRRLLFTETIHAVNVKDQTEMFRIRMLEDKHNMAACMLQGIQFHFDSQWKQMTNQNQGLINAFLADNEAAVFEYVEKKIDITEDPNDFVTTDDLYNSFKNWKNHYSPGSKEIIKNTFAKKFGVVVSGMQKNVKAEGKKINNRFIRGYKGIKILKEEDTSNSWIENEFD